MNPKLELSYACAQESCPAEHRSEDSLYVPFRFQKKLVKDEKLFHIKDSIYIGTENGVSDLSFLGELNIRHIINLTSGSTKVSNYKCDVMYTNIELKDNIGEDVDKILKNMKACVELLSNNNRNRIPTVIHCNAGLSRSASMVIAWLMSENSYTLYQAVENFAKKRGRCAVCSPSYWTALYKYEKEIAKEQKKAIPAKPTYDFSAHICDDISIESGEASSIMLATTEEIKQALEECDYDANTMIQEMLIKKYGN